MVRRDPTSPPKGAFTFFLVQGEVDAGLPLGAVAEAVEGKQVAFPVVPMKVESPVWREAHGKQFAR